MIRYVLVLSLLAATASAQWSPNTIPVVRPTDFGATDCAANDLAALQSAINALPATGGIVRLTASATAVAQPRCTRKDGLLAISKPNVLLWGENGAATLRTQTGGVAGSAAVQFDAAGGGVYGVRLVVSDYAGPRSSGLPTTLLAFNTGTTAEVIGCELTGAPSSGIMLYGTTSSVVQGNYIHHTWADHIHHTAGAHDSYVWANTIFNEAPSNGDDGVAAVTYGPNSTKVSNVEIWKNSILHTGGGRGIACVGGANMSIHDNWVSGTHSAGIYIASEGGYDSATCTDISVARNTLVGVAQVTTSHSGILVYGGNSNAPPVSNVSVVDNTVYGQAAQAYRAQGSYTGVTETGTVAAEPTPAPTAPIGAALADTSVLRTRNVSFAPSACRPGLYRIRVRQPSAGGLQMAYEYVVKGTPGQVTSWVLWQRARGAQLLAQKTVSGTAYAGLLLPLPVTIPATLTGVTMSELRAGANGGALGAWLWDALEQ